MNHTKTQMLLPIKILEAAHLLLYTVLLLFRGRKKKLFKASHGPKTWLVACVFAFVLILTFIGSMRTGIPVFSTCPFMYAKINENVGFL